MYIFREYLTTILGSFVLPTNRAEFLLYNLYCICNRFDVLPWPVWKKVESNLYMYPPCIKLRVDSVGLGTNLGLCAPSVVSPCP